MRFPTVHGVIGRRLLINFRIDPDVAQRQLPEPFRPKLHDGHAVGGICLIRLEGIRPKHIPQVFGISSENAAHRFAVTWTDATGEREGVYIPRRDSNSLFNHLAGGRLFPGEHQRATFVVDDTAERIRLQMTSEDGKVSVGVVATRDDEMPKDSIFRSVDEASAFFEPGSLGYSATRGARKLDGIVLRTHSWEVKPLHVEEVASSYFGDPSLFPPGSATFDCGLIMRNIAHEWQAAEGL